MEFSHIPVLLEQAVDALAVKKNGIYVDGTCLLYTSDAADEL